MNCCVCKNKSKETSYHAFPEEPEMRIKWLEAFGFTETDINNSMQICGDHFDDACFVNIQGEDLKIKSILLKGSVPTIQLNYHFTRRKPDNEALHGTNNSIAEVSSNVGIGNNMIEVPRFNLRESIEVQSATVKNREIADPGSNVSSCDNEACTQLVKDAQTCTQNAPNASDNSQPKVKRKIWRPAYVSQIDLEHGFDNPVIAKMHFQTAKSRVEFLEKKVRTLNQQLRRLESKTEQQSTSIKLLKHESLISKRITTKVEATTSETLKEVISRQSQPKTKKFSPQLLDFAMNLHFYSPKAYEYVRTNLKNMLPRATTIAKWYHIVDGNPTPIKGEASDSVLNESDDELADDSSINDEMDIDENEHIDSSLEENCNGEITEEGPST